MWHSSRLPRSATRIFLIPCLGRCWYFGGGVHPFPMMSILLWLQEAIAFYLPIPFHPMPTFERGLKCAWLASADEILLWICEVSNRACEKLWQAPPLLAFFRCRRRLLHHCAVQPAPTKPFSFWWLDSGVLSIAHQPDVDHHRCGGELKRWEITWRVGP